MKRFGILPLLLSLGCASADGSAPIPPEQASPEAHHESSVCRVDETFVAWQSDGLTHVSQRKGALTFTEHYSDAPPFRSEFQGVDVSVSADLDVCLL